MAKNSEVYKTARERADAYKEYCHKHYVKCQGCSGCPLNYKGMCCFAWLDLECEEEKTLPCPFCGNDVEYDDELGVFNCTSCNYMSCGNPDKASAIAAHNRVAKAVKESEGNDEAN